MLRIDVYRCRRCGRTFHEERVPIRAGGFGPLRPTALHPCSEDWQGVGDLIGMREGKEVGDDSSTPVRGVVPGSDGEGGWAMTETLVLVGYAYLVAGVLIAMFTLVLGDGRMGVLGSVLLVAGWPYFLLRVRRLLRRRGGK